MKITVAILVLLATTVAWGQDYLDPDCMEKYFVESLQDCGVTPPPCDSCDCPQLGSPCGPGWTQGDMLTKEACCDNRNEKER